LAAGPELVTYFQNLCKSRAAGDLQSCYPMDIMGILAAMAAYQRRPVEVTRENMDAAAETYFAQVPGAGGGTYSATA